MRHKDFKLQPKTPKISKKNVWKPSSKAVLAKFNKLLSGTKNCGPPRGIYLLPQKNSKADYGEKRVCDKTNISQFGRSFSTLGEISYM